MSRLRRALVTLVVLSQVVACPSLVWACTGITIKPKDGSIIFARTLEFAVDIKSNIIVVPRGKEYVGTAPGDKPGLRWKTKYGIVGANAFDLPVTVDGLNEKGLHVGLFYFPGFAKYQEIKAEDVGKALAPWELGVFLLGTCSDVKEAVAAAKEVLVGEVVQKDMGFVPAVHYILTDASGKSVVLEHVGGELKIHENPLGVMTNSPTFDWHMTNLSNYVNLTVSNVPKIDVGGKEIKGLGQGSGMLGIPGDFTPPSRFVGRWRSRRVPSPSKRLGRVCCKPSTSSTSSTSRRERHGAWSMARRSPTTRSGRVPPTSRTCGTTSEPTTTAGFG